MPATASAAKEKKNDLWFIAVLAAVFLFDLYKIRIGMYHDEPIHVDYGKLFLTGQLPLTQVWDFLQMPGLLAAPFTAVFMGVTGGTAGLILFQRQVWLVLHILITVFTYRTLIRRLSKTQAQVVTLFLAVFVWHFYIICYKSMLIWGVTLMLLGLLRYEEKESARWMILADVSLCAAVLSFPTAILLAVPVSWYLLKSASDKKKSLLLFLGGCGLIGLAVIIFVLCTMPGGSLQILIEVYLKAAEKSDHGTAGKMIRRFGEIGAMWIGANVLSFAYAKVPALRKAVKNENRFLLLVLIGAIAGAVILRSHKISTSLIWCAFLAFFFTAEALARRGYMGEQGPSFVRPLFLSMSLWLLVVITLATNTGIAVIAFGCVFGMAGVLILLTRERERKERDARLLCGAILAVHLFAAMFFVLEYDLDYSPTVNRTHHILQARTKVTQGPGKGLYFNEDTLTEYENALIAASHIEENDRVFLVSEHYRRYVALLATNAAEVVHSELEYETDSPLPGIWCDVNPDIFPTVVLIDLDFTWDLNTWLATTPPGQYITEHFDMSTLQGDHNWVIIRR